MLLAVCPIKSAPSATTEKTAQVRQLTCRRLPPRAPPGTDNRRTRVTITRTSSPPQTAHFPVHSLSLSPIAAAHPPVLVAEEAITTACRPDAVKKPATSGLNGRRVRARTYLPLPVDVYRSQNSRLGTPWCEPTVIWTLSSGHHVSLTPALIPRFKTARRSRLLCRAGHTD